MPTCLISITGAFRCHEQPHVSSPGIGEELSLACLGIGGDDAGRNIHTPVGYHMHRWRDLDLHQTLVSSGRRLGDSRAHSERASTHIYHASGKPIRNWKLRARKLHQRLPKKHASCRCIIETCCLCASNGLEQEVGLLDSKAWAHQGSGQLKSAPVWA